MSTIFVTSLGSVAADITIKTLHRLGHKVVGSDINQREHFVDAMEVDAFYQAPYSADVYNYLPFAEKVCAEQNVDYVFPMTDVDIDVFNANRERMAATGAVFCMSPKSVLDTIRNKPSRSPMIWLTQVGHGFDSRKSAPHNAPRQAREARCGMPKGKPYENGADSSSWAMTSA